MTQMHECTEAQLAGGTMTMRLAYSTEAESVAPEQAEGSGARWAQERPVGTDGTEVTAAWALMARNPEPTGGAAAVLFGGLQRHPG